VDTIIEYTCDIIKGMRDVHSVRSIGAMHVNKLLKKTLACFYCFCVDPNFLDSKNLPGTI